LALTGDLIGLKLIAVINLDQQFPWLIDCIGLNCPCSPPPSTLALLLFSAPLIVALRTL
jgi:hypothetical protein